MAVAVTGVRGLTTSLLWGCALGVLGLLDLGVPCTANAREARADPTALAVQGVDLSACTASPLWQGVSVRVSLVVHPDGRWALGIEDAVADARYATESPRLRSCIEDAFVARLGRVIAPAPAGPRVYVRELQGASQQSEPSPRAVRRELFLTRVAQAAESLGRCFDHRGPAQVRVQLRLRASGEIEVRLPSPFGSEDEVCVSTTLGGFDAGEGEVRVTRTFRVPDPRRPVVVGVGALCRWGEHHGTPAPRLTQCARGLVCCSGGAAGSDGYCHRGPHCAPVP